MALDVDSDGRAPPPAAAASAGTTATEVGFLWELRKYVLLLATLAASLTYSPGLNPPGGFVYDQVLWPAFALPSTPALQMTDALRYNVFFYCNATAFIASIVIILLLLAHSLSRRRWWLRALQGAMILDQFGLMGAYAAGSCRKVAMSAFVIALVGMVAFYVCAHVLIFALCAMRRRDASESTAPEAPESVERTRKCLLIFATLAVTVTYQTGLSIPDSFLSGDSSVQFLVFFYFNTTAFVASLVVIILLMSRTITRNGFQSSALWVCTGAALVGLTGAFSVGCSRSIKTSIYVILLPVAALFYIGIQALVFLCKPVENLFRTVQEKMCKHLRLDNMTGKNHHHEAGSNQRQQGNSDSDQLLQKSRMYLLLLGIFAATVTYQAGLNPPGGFWKLDSSKLGVPILHIAHPGRYLVFFYCNATAFVASLVILTLLLSNVFSTHGIKYYALQIAMILDLLGLIGAYAAGISQEAGSKYVYFSVLVPVFLCICLHVLVPMIEVSPSSGTWAEVMREKLVGYAPEWLKNFFQMQTVDEDENMERKLEKSRKLLLLLAILAANLTYQAGMNPPGGFWQEPDPRFHIGDPILIDDFPRRYLAFIYCNTTAFVASLAIIMLLVNRKLSARPIQSHALRLCVILVLVGLVVAFFAGCFKKVLPSIHVFVLVFAVLCIAVLVAVVVSVCQRHLQKFISRLGMLDEGSSYILPHTTVTGGAHDPWKRKLPKYLLLLAVLVAAVTYQAAMNPPGGLWDDFTVQISRGTPGDPILLMSDPARYKDQAKDL